MSIGYILYVKSRNQAIPIEKGEEIKTETSDCLIDITVDAYIHEKYIPYTKNRIESYKRIASLENSEDVSDLLDEFVDRYGDVPQSVMGLIDISLLRVVASSVGIYEVTQRKDCIMFYSNAFDKIDMAKFLKDTKHKITIKTSGKACVRAQIKQGKNPIDVMKDMISLFKETYIC